MKDLLQRKYSYQDEWWRYELVHGGISLQEMVVPVIEYHYLRNDSMEYKRNRKKYDTKPVTVNLLSRKP